MNHILAIFALATACALWVVVQRWVAQRDPGQPGVEGGCHNCSGCSKKADPADTCAPR